MAKLYEFCNIKYEIGEMENSLEEVPMKTKKVRRCVKRCSSKLVVDKLSCGYRGFHFILLVSFAVPVNFFYEKYNND